MNKEEIPHILTAILVFTLVLSFGGLISGNYSIIGFASLAAAIIIISNIAGKKIMAYMLDADVSHKLWFTNYFGFTYIRENKIPFPTGIVLPLVATILTSGYLKIASMLEYSTSAKKIRAAKRFGYYSYTEMTDWHNALIGAGGMIMTFILIIVTYLLGYEPLAKAAAFYMFWNMVPVANLDGTQMFFGSKILWSIMSILAFLSAVYAVLG